MTRDRAPRSTRDLYPPPLPDRPSPLTASKLRELLPEACCPLPTKLSDREQERFDHQDLPDLSDFELSQQKDRARLRLAIEDRPDPWVQDRLRATQEEERKRVAR